jgi:16S rRNA (guanine1516-N2)-methyltransferase
MWLNNPMTSIKISYQQVEQQLVATELAAALGLEIIDPSELTRSSKLAHKAESSAGYFLEVSSDGIALVPFTRKAHGPIICDFASSANSHRRKYGGGNGQAIAKAVGLSGKFQPKVLDLTAGLGGDAFVLASLGCQIQLIERNPIVHCLLADGLQRAGYSGNEDRELADIVARMDLIEGDSIHYLEHLNTQQLPDIIYLDPMFPERKKSAKVKKEMQAFHGIVGGDEDAAELLDLALQRAQYRVVVKRSASAGYLGNKTPSYSLEGKSTRFDIFALQKLPG